MTAEGEGAEGLMVILACSERIRVTLSTLTLVVLSLGRSWGCTVTSALNQTPGKSNQGLLLEEEVWIIVFVRSWMLFVVMSG